MLAKEILFYEKSTVNPLYFYGRCAVYLISFVWGWQFMPMDYGVLVDGYPEISNSFMDRVNLVFHKTGHVIFIPLGGFMTILGGSLGQLLIPLTVLCALLLNTRDTFGAATGP
jgi:hypothetical protein